MINIIPAQINKPDRVNRTEEQKDERYHADYARYVASAVFTPKYATFLKDYSTNRRFYKNDQWWVDEDKATFLMDDNGETNNRIKVTRNFIQPMVDQFRGNAERMVFTSKVVSLSPLVKSKRDEVLNRLLMYTDVANVSPGFGQFIKKEYPNIGSNERETLATFENLYVDKYIQSLNNLLINVREANRVDSYRKIIAQDIALSGMGIIKPYIHSGQLRAKVVSPDNFGWDGEARQYNLGDAQHFAEQHFYMVSELAEMFQLDQVVVKALERYVSSITNRGTGGSMYNTLGRVPAFESTWRDIVWDEFGYVYDKFGQVVLKRLNDPEVEEGDRVTDSDLLPYKDLTPFQKRTVKENGSVGKAKLFCDLWRYCIFIPAEVTGISIGGAKLGDIVLEYGVLPYQENDLYQPTNMSPPYKVGMYLYDDGDVIAPVTVAINPQRMINRFLSILDNQLNNSGGSGPIIDSDMLSEVDGEKEAIKSIKKGKPLFISGKGMGVQNSVGQYNSTVRGDTLVLSNLIQDYKRGMEETTGVSDAMKGGNAPDQLVGVMQLALQRGAIGQQPFYGAMQEIFQGFDQTIITSGKRLYIDNETELLDLVGGDGVATFKLSKDIRNESFRAYLQIGLDPTLERDKTDQMIVTFAQLGLLDEGRVSNLIGRAGSEDVYMAVREFNREKLEMKRIAAKQAEIAQANAGQQQNAMVATALDQKAQDRAVDLTKNRENNDTIIASKLIDKAGG